MRAMRFLVQAIAVLIFIVPVQAAETLWQELAPDVSIRLISTGVVTPLGTTIMALELDMPEGTKTYWRVPGETGFPLDLTLAGSTGVGAYEMHWPYPTRDDRDGYLDYVYYGHTILPFEVDVTDKTGTLELAATLGVCSDICIPAQAKFSLPLMDAAPDRASGLRIKQTLAEVPIAWTAAERPIGAVEVMPQADVLAVEVSPDKLDPQSLIVASMDGYPLFGAPQKSQQAGLVLLPILGKTDNSALDGLDVELTFMTESGAFSVSRTIGAGDANNAQAAL
jgi:DsbC/DsbD-like thiol-disulfide interchange protein